MSDPRERKVDERLAGWVDDCLSDRERERFAAELRVNPQLRKDLEEYERTVATLRAALRAPIAATNLADRVMQAIAEPAERSGGSSSAGNGREVHRRPFGGPVPRWLPLVGSIAAAAALLALALWLNSWHTNRPLADAQNDVASATPAELGAPVRDHEALPASAAGPEAEVVRAKEIEETALREKAGAPGDADVGDPAPSQPAEGSGAWTETPKDKKVEERAEPKAVQDAGDAVPKAVPTVGAGDESSRSQGELVRLMTGSKEDEKPSADHTAKPAGPGGPATGSPAVGGPSSSGPSGPSRGAPPGSVSPGSGQGPIGLGAPAEARRGGRGNPPKAPATVPVRQLPMVTVTATSSAVLEDLQRDETLGYLAAKREQTGADAKAADTDMLALFLTRQIVGGGAGAGTAAGDLDGVPVTFEDVSASDRDKEKQRAPEEKRPEETRPAPKPPAEKAAPNTPAQLVPFGATVLPQRAIDPGVDVGAGLRIAELIPEQSTVALLGFSRNDKPAEGAMEKPDAPMAFTVVSPVVSERTWILEGDRAAVAEVLRKLSALSARAGAQLSNGELPVAAVMPWQAATGAATDAPTGGTPSGAAGGAKAKAEVATPASETVQIVLRFRVTR